MVHILNFKNPFTIFLWLFAFIAPVRADFSPNFSSCIAQNETSGKPLAQAAAIQNKLGYTGIYQMGVNYVGGYLCSNYASIPKMGGTTPQDWNQCDFKGTLAKPVSQGGLGITSYAAFTTGANAVAAQQAIFQKVSQQEWNQIVSLGYSKYLGQTVNGVVMTQDTMVAMAHMSGVGGLGKTLAGSSITDKTTGATPTSYASCLATCISGGGTSALCSLVSKINKVTTDACETPSN